MQKKREEIPETEPDCHSLWEVQWGNWSRNTEVNRERPDLGNPHVETQNRFEALTHHQGTVADSADYACEVCQKRFQAKIGLGQHIRHRHPDLANQKRIDAVEADIERKRRARREEATSKASKPSSRQTDKPKKGNLWTQEETDLLVALNIKCHGERYINKAIEKEMNGKTSKKISDKRRAMGLIDSDPKSKPARASTRAAAPKRQAGGSKADEPGIEQLDQEPEVMDMRPCFREAIELEGPSTLVGDSAETLLRAVRDDGSYQESEKIVIDLLKERCKPSENKRTTRKMGKANQKGKPPKGKKAKEKAKQFRTDQYLFENDRSRKALSKRLLDGKESNAKCNLDPEVVEQTYKGRLGGVSQEVDLSSYPPTEKVDNNELLKPFTSKTVKAAMRKAKKNTAAGPDKTDLKKLLTVDRQGKTLTNLFNTWLLTGYVPEAVKENRSILLPKGTEGLDNINNWRPLTISSIVLRLYTNLLASRVLKEFKINERQRGFIKASGCAENGFLIEKVIEHAKKNRNPLVVTFLDLAKAFDTVSHKHITVGLRRFGASNVFIKIVENLYGGASTKFTTSEGTTGAISMTRGVKQGDPLSPFLFNTAMDPLLAAVSRQGNGYKFGPGDSDRIESLAYADDNSLLTGSAEEMNTNLAIVNRFCAETDMRLDVKKSAAFCIRPAGSRTYTVNVFTTPLVVGEEKILLIKPSETTKYLGSKISPWVNRVNQELVPKLEQMLKGIDKSSLRPRQKLLMLERYALPRLTFPLSQEHNTQGTLLELDRTVRSYVSKWLHLHPSTCKGVVHSRKTDGGLGLPELVRSVPAQRINALKALLRSADPKIRTMAEAMDVRGLIASYAASANLKVPSSETVKAKWHTQPITEWSNLSAMGQGVTSFKGKTSNAWNSWDGNVAKQTFEADYITTLKLRTNTYPCSAALARGRDIDPTCRRCGLTVETLGHISRSCPSVKDYRIKRHNVLTNTVAERAKQEEWCIAYEPRLLGQNNEMFKPDLVLVKGNKAVVLDPTIVYENGDSLERANRGKEEKYQQLVPIVQEKFNVTEVEVRGLDIGCRGGWVHANSQTLHMLGIRDPGFEQHLCTLALKGTINLVRLFSDK